MVAAFVREAVALAALALFGHMVIVWADLAVAL